MCNTPPPVPAMTTEEAPLERPYLIGGWVIAGAVAGGCLALAMGLITLVLSVLP